MGRVLGAYEEHRLKRTEKSERRKEGIRRDSNLSMLALQANRIQESTSWVLIIVRCMILRYSV